MIRVIARQRWLSRSLRRRFVQRVAPPVGTTFEAERFGCLYQGRLDSYIDREVYYFGDYEPAILNLIERLTEHRAGSVFVDVGANVGQHTLFASGICGQVHAFEPYPPLVALLEEQVARNRLTHVHVHAVGLGDEDGEADYAAPADSRAGYGGFENHDPNLQRLRLPVRRGDSYFAALGISKIDIVKIDVEGGECRVVRGLRDLLAKNRPAVIAEFWPAVWAPDPLEYLPEHYRVWSLREGRTSGLVFQSHRATLQPIQQAAPGGTMVALPAEWSPPLTVGRG